MSSRAAAQTHLKLKLTKEMSNRFSKKTEDIDILS